MSRYLILFLLCLPFILIGILSALTQYKLKRITRRSFNIQIIIWIALVVGLISAESLYDWLFARGYTSTDTLSLFDVIQITAIVIVFYISNLTRMKNERLERRLNDLHQEISIQLSNK